MVWPNTNNFLHKMLFINMLKSISQPHWFLPNGHCFALICRKYDVKHRVTKPAQPRTNGPAECLNRTIKHD